MIFQAGDSDEGREFAARRAPTRSSAGTAPSRTGQAFYTDVKGRLARHGRTPDQLLILPAATFVLGDTDAEAEELAREVRRQQVSGATAIKFLEQVWNRDLSGYDPDGPLPDIDPDLGEHTIARGRASVRMYRDPLATAREWRERAAAKKLSIRELVIETGNRQSFVGSPATVAETINDFVQADAADGFILVPHITPGGLDAFADTVVPLLQERGVFRTSTRAPPCATTWGWPIRTRRGQGCRGAEGRWRRGEGGRCLARERRRRAGGDVRECMRALRKLDARPAAFRDLSLIARLVHVWKVTGSSFFALKPLTSGDH